MNGRRVVEVLEEIAGPGHVERKSKGREPPDALCRPEARIRDSFLDLIFDGRGRPIGGRCI